MHNQTDIELVVAVQNGDIPAFELLVKRYQYGLHVFVVRYVRDWDVASDIVQETLITIYRVIDTVDVQKKFSTFLFEIAKNKAISYLRSQKKLVHLEQIDDYQQDSSFIEDYLRADVVESVHKAVNSLPDKYKKVITLYYFE